VRSRLGTGISLTFLQCNVSVYHYSAERQLYTEGRGVWGGGGGGRRRVLRVCEPKKTWQKPTIVM
jgi:hypothetical protein